MIEVYSLQCTIYSLQCTVKIMSQGYSLAFVISVGETDLVLTAVGFNPRCKKALIKPDLVLIAVGFKPRRILSPLEPCR